MTIAITGATGELGRRVVAALTARGAEGVVALARDPGKAADLGVEARAFDYDAPDTLAPALRGVDTLLLISSPTLGERERQHRAVIEAAKTANVGRIVYTSVLHADRSTLSLADEHRATEAVLADSGLAVTVLRNGWYTENYMMAVPAALEHGALIGAAGDGRISSATRDDYADAAAVAVLDDAHADKTFELAGDTAWTLADLAAELSARTGRDIPYVDMPEAAYAEALVSAGLDPSMATALAGFDAAASRGALFDDSGTLSRLIGRATTPMAKSVAPVVD